MPRYALWLDYTAEGLQAAIRSGFVRAQQRIEVEITRAGGQFLCAMTMNGEYGQLVLADLPDAQSCAALYVALSRDATMRVRTSRVFTRAEMDAARRQSPPRSAAAEPATPCQGRAGPLYLIRTSYTPASLEAAIRRGFAASIRQTETEITRLGGFVLHAMTFNGEYDHLFVAELPDAERCAAVYLALSRRGALKVQTSRVFTAAEMDAALRRVRRLARPRGGRTR